MNHMGFESSLTRQEIAIDNQKLQKLTIREFCMLTREEVLSADGMTVDKLSAIERLLDEYSLRLGMSAGELDAYLDCYYQERPEEKKFYDLCDRMCESVATSGAKPLSTRRDSEPSWTGNYMAILWMGQGSAIWDGCITRPCARLT